MHQITFPGSVATDAASCCDGPGANKSLNAGVGLFSAQLPSTLSLGKQVSRIDLVICTPSEERRNPLYTRATEVAQSSTQVRLCQALQSARACVCLHSLLSTLQPCQPVCLSVQACPYCEMTKRGGPPIGSNKERTAARMRTSGFPCFL